jgi:hypothetical protein
MLLGAAAMAIWFMRISAAICIAAIVSVVGLFGYEWYCEAANDAALAAVQEHVESLGGSFSQDVFEDNYVIVLDGPEIGDDHIAGLVVLLQPLTAVRSSPHVPERFAFNLAGTKVGDPGVQAIATLPVSWLNLNGTQVSDAGLMHLRQQSQLSIVTLSGTRVTRPGIDAFSASKPQVWIPVASQARARP